MHEALKYLALRVIKDATADINYWWNLRWNGRAAERARVNCPWPTKQSA
jgi:hypothetical protein